MIPRLSTLIVLSPLTLTSLLLAQAPESAPPVPPPVLQAPARGTLAAAEPGANQRLYGPAAETLIARPTAEGVIEGFRKSYKTDGTPRIVVYVNRALVDTASGLKLTDRIEQFEKSDTATKTTGTNTYKAAAKPAATLADQQTVREIERLFGRAFRHAGAQLADQQVAASLLPEQPGAHLVGDQAGKDRAALANIADIAIEVLISSRNLVVPEVSGDASYAVPDIQATAIRLKDAAIVGQASAADVIGKGAAAGRAVRQFSVQDITEATALALMEDMLTGKR
jgi:hypothetical protein